MPETRYFGELAVVEADPCIETIEAIPYEGQSHQVHHTRVAGKFASEEHSQLEAVVIRHFTDEETPHGRWGIQFPPSTLSKVETGLGILRMEYL